MLNELFTKINGEPDLLAVAIVVALILVVTRYVWSKLDD